MLHEWIELDFDLHLHTFDWSPKISEARITQQRNASTHWAQKSGVWITSRRFFLGGSTLWNLSIIQLDQFDCPGGRGETFKRSWLMPGRRTVNWTNGNKRRKRLLCPHRSDLSPPQRPGSSRSSPRAEARSKPTGHKNKPSRTRGGKLSA